MSSTRSSVILRKNCHAIRRSCYPCKLLVRNVSPQTVTSICLPKQLTCAMETLFWALSQYKDSLTRYEISIIKIRRSWYRLIFFIMGIPIPVRRHLYTETGRWLIFQCFWSGCFACWNRHIDGLAQDCTGLMELLQSCTKPSTWYELPEGEKAW